VNLIEENGLKRLESENPQGLTSKEILDVFQDHGLSLSEATLRKYVQLGLLPRSVRVGQKGKHRGSKGVYPVRVVRQIVLVKRLMAHGYTIEQIQEEFLFLRGELEELEETLGGIFLKLGNVLKENNRPVALGFAREVNAVEGVGRDLMIRLRTLERRLSSERRSSSAAMSLQEVQGAVG